MNMKRIRPSQIGDTWNGQNYQINSKIVPFLNFLLSIRLKALGIRCSKKTLVYGSLNLKLFVVYLYTIWKLGSKNNCTNAQFKKSFMEHSIVYTLLINSMEKYINISGMNWTTRNKKFFMQPSLK